ncbi:GHKL domain-containing protein [Enterococcus hulanensis]|uniref:GHKL domain-containing protein n=1 Tax=Enterococcus hulanensis TaxID=2559929 RepID=UPI00288F36D3|nr:GHKL domain-containing protein [Enterococcus hulanensis]MDT2661136.1 GHKL domain-containing protein [Enterococcus hulanensis]
MLGALLLFYFLQTSTLPSLLIPSSILLVLLAASSYQLGGFFAEKRASSERKKNLENYIYELENLNDELRTFKHDYLNILSTLEQSIHERDMVQIEKIYTQTIAPTKHQIMDKRTDIQKYHNIGFLELKSLLVSKEMEAKNGNCILNLAIIGKIENPTSNSLDLIRAISILIDNAIQAASSSALDNKIEVLIISTDIDLIFSCRNSIKELDFDKKKIFDKSYSTKKNGHPKTVGLGLYSLKRILSNNPTFTLSTEFKNEYINQTLFIKDYSK